MFVQGFGKFGDVRAGLAGAAFGGFLGYVCWGPMGVAGRMEAAEKRRIAEVRPEVRGRWLLGAAGWVFGVTLALAVLLAIVS